MTGGYHIRQHSSRETSRFLAWKFTRTTLVTAVLKAGLVLHMWTEDFGTATPAEPAPECTAPVQRATVIAQGGAGRVPHTHPFRPWVQQTG